MQILVTGSSGFIASHLILYLADQGHRLHGLDLVEPDHTLPLSSFRKGDIRNRDDVQGALEGVDLVVNLAASHHDIGPTREDYFDHNERGTQVLLTAMSALGIKCFVFTSSVAVYGDLVGAPDEQTAPSPTSYYGASKLAAERVIAAWVEDDSSRKAAIIRPCVVFGERNKANTYNLIRQIDSGRFFIFGSGKNVKATAYVGNVVQAIGFLIERLQPGIETYNYSDQPDLPVNEIVSIIAQGLDRREPLHLPLSLGILAAMPFGIAARLIGHNIVITPSRVRKLAMETRVDSGAIRVAGFMQTVTTADGLRRMIQHMFKVGALPSDGK